MNKIMDLHIFFKEGGQFFLIPIFLGLLGFSLISFLSFSKISGFFGWVFLILFSIVILYIWILL